MRRDPRAYLWDIREAVDSIAVFVEGLDESGYCANAMVKSAVERQLEIIGEALNQLSMVDQRLAEQIPQRRQAIGLRNVLIHGYAKVNDALVWRTVCSDVPALRHRVAVLLDELSDES